MGLPLGQRRCYMRRVFCNSGALGRELTRIDRKPAFLPVAHHFWGGRLGTVRAEPLPQRQAVARRRHDYGSENLFWPIAFALRAYHSIAQSRAARIALPSWVV